ncbi:lytic transglycosylase [Mesorhizobium sp. M4B.F.Ca.ET.215.01.1.1]|uniref:lytic transglycosylase domain-containing protein n=1 Tax=unclassified Mesorhizobium TaxID=325217 RepID=UPI000FC9AC9C|nr:MULTISPECIES: lytic transglycosylase domain-containing protein [unclassified Mesorhizobium]RUW22469.1 lytic transglycosylase [Mesorhizobium sp. M4B.F.Ca.ET.013.02.1.1]RVD44619.1 lytic transglycosylase [Mesorhizobium sp. M4B.F.Ca.ET.019.03.1.1]RWF61684.1 MAG: lytic transglycosylase [Mesorhizobium sp.]TGQ07139.1 lytic transglycosylase [Mesorhizobium sp. M4B.F.Ca.ET.215.01.1.1]TGQ29695.1 lytic transglycosylase [Mesorhizobium sp. M4B.F.Ca.ET.214.01.1.1]
MRRFLRATLILLCGAGWVTIAQADPPPSAKQRLIGKVCNLIEAHAVGNGLPKDFFARLIWKESRFDPNAVSPVGAEGIAQFMPGTAKMRGLANPFDIEQAIPASAKYLAEMKVSYGNLGLAAAAYNAGENRVSRWLGSGGFLPMETESYVFDVMGEPVDKFSDGSYAGNIEPLDAKASFAVACRKLPVIMSQTVAMASINVKPWGVQVAGNFRRSAAVGQWLRVRSRFPALLSNHDPVVSRVRTPIGRRGIYAVRIGADSRGEANGICQKLHGVGGACLVVRNR